MANASTELIYVGSDDVDEIAWYSRNAERVTETSTPTTARTTLEFDC